MLRRGLANGLAMRRIGLMQGRVGLCRGFEEFFDQSAHLDNGERKSGRSWSAKELRLKSFDDLHKLWFVLLKEENMLLTERHMARSMHDEMANPERLIKVRKSKARLKTVLHERTRAYKARISEIEKEVKASQSS